MTLSTLDRSQPIKLLVAQLCATCNGTQQIPEVPDAEHHESDATPPRGKRKPAAELQESASESRIIECPSCAGSRIAGHRVMLLDLAELRTTQEHNIQLR